METNFALVCLFTMSMQELHNLGASTIIVMNVIPLGCTPGYLSFLTGSNSNGTLDEDGCLTSINNVVDLHNTQLQHLINKLRAELLLSNLVVFDANAIYRDAIRHPSKYGILISTLVIGTTSFTLTQRKTESYLYLQIQYTIIVVVALYTFHIVTFSLKIKYLNS